MTYIVTLKWQHKHIFNRIMHRNLEEAFKKSLSINNSHGLMCSKTQVHKDKSKELLPEQVHPNISKLPSVYHATFLDHAKDIAKKGVDPSRAKGSGQGAGFYVFTDLQTAIRHAKDLFKGGVEKEDESILQGNPVCVVVLQLQKSPIWDPLGSGTPYLTPER